MFYDFSQYYFTLSLFTLETEPKTLHDSTSFFCYFQFLLAELNTFYLKFVLWIPPEHYLCLTRLVFFLFMGAAALREGFQYLDDP